MPTSKRATGQESESSGVMVDKKVVNLLLKKIILMEKTNSKTRNRNDAEMVRAIKKEIEEAVECY